MFTLMISQILLILLVIILLVIPKIKDRKWHRFQKNLLEKGQQYRKLVREGMEPKKAKERVFGPEGAKALADGTYTANTEKAFEDLRKKHMDQ